MHLISGLIREMAFCGRDLIREGLPSPGRGFIFENKPSSR
jgi:hypothetical protein